MTQIQLEFVKNFKDRKLKRFIFLFIAIFSIGLSGSFAQVAMPTNGSCALMLTLPIPYGFDVGSNVNRNNVRGVYETGYNFIGTIQFSGSSSVKLSGLIINPTFNINDSPYIAQNSSVIINDLPGSVQALNRSNGFDGGYKFIFSGSLSNGKVVGMVMTGVATNGGKTIMLVLSEGSGPGPGSGVCQF